MIREEFKRTALLLGEGGVLRLEKATVAVFGIMAASEVTASAAFAFARPSKVFPSATRVRIMAADSKYRLW